MFDKLRRVWPLLFSSFFGFLLATFIFMPRAYSSNQNVYKILREKIAATPPLRVTGRS